MFKCCNISANIIWLLSGPFVLRLSSWALVLGFVTHVICKQCLCECYVVANGIRRLQHDKIQFGLPYHPIWCLIYDWNPAVCVFSNINNIFFRLPCHPILYLFQTKLWLWELKYVGVSLLILVLFLFLIGFKFWCWSQKTTHFDWERVTVSIGTNATLNMTMSFPL